MQGRLLGHRYRINRSIGEGGMASVYLATDEKLGRKVAVKVLHARFCENEELRRRFLQEARTLSSMDHPNIVKIFDFSGTDSRRLWIVTEIIRGENLSKFAKHFPSRQIPPVLATIIVVEVCKALRLAHAKGVYHRDVKPENVMIIKDGRVKLMDFGIAKNIHRGNLTMTGTFMGSPSYMSPEQIKGSSDHRSDIYSLSIMLYELTTGRLPFSGGSPEEIILQVSQGKFSPPQQWLPELPDEINKIIVRGMALKANERHSTIASMMDKLAQFLADSGFEESHVELERYFRNTGQFQKRVQRKNQETVVSQKEVNRTVPPSPVAQEAAGSYRERRGTPALPRGGTARASGSRTRTRTRGRRPTTDVWQDTRLRRYQYLSGIIIIGAILITAMAGYLAIQRKLREARSPARVQEVHPVKKAPRRPVKTRKTRKKTSRIPAKKLKARTSTPEKSVTPAPATPTPPVSRTRDSTNKDAPRKKTKSRAPERVRKKSTERAAPFRTSLPASGNRQPPGATFLRSFPAAEITLDGVSKGTTNSDQIMNNGLTLTPGKHTLVLQREGYKKLTRQIMVKPGARQTLSFVLEKISDVVPLTINSSVYPVRLIIRNQKNQRIVRQYANTGSAVTLKVGRGTYQITAIAGSRRVNKRITILDGQSQATVFTRFEGRKP